jgi:small subunit ribosomal protein S9
MEKKPKKYIEAVGRRKTSSARVRLTESGKDTFVVNDKDMKVYFPTKELQTAATSALKEVGELTTSYDITVKVSGGGIHSQAEAIRHGLARVLSTFGADPEQPLVASANKLKLKKAGMLKRDPRAKERRKFGLKKARKAPQWSKR